MAVQNFLRSCKDASSRAAVKDTYLNFSRDQCDIDNGRFYLRTPLLKEPSTDEPPVKRQRQSNRDDDQPVTNPKINQQCKLATGENYHTLFLKNGIAQPKQEGKPICLNYQIRGTCIKTCRRSHKPLTAESTQALIKFCTDSRTAA